ncbi:MAG: hypothetical protein ACTSX1_00645 [Candidatus Heimdallarchaeaceae archaeon]
MKILKRTITTLASQGRISLQVPQYNIITEGNRAIAYDANHSKDEDVIDIPDEWIIYLRYGSPAVGRESGHAFLTKMGWQDNKDEIKKAFESSKHPRGTWQDFENHVVKHFSEVEKQTKRRIKLLKSKLDQLRKGL